MTDDLEALRELRAGVEPPSSAVRRAARARWNGDPVDVVTDPVRRWNGVRVFSVRTAMAGAVAVAVLAGALFVTRARINSVKPAHVVSVGSLTDAPATQPQVFLLIGSDSRAFVNNNAQAQQFGDPATVGGARSDTIVLVRIDPTSHRVLLVSIPRDLWVPIPGHGSAKINAAFAYGGAALLTQTITQDLGVPVNHVIEVEFPQLSALVDELGGLRIDFPVPARDANSGLDEPAGCITLNGSEALAFVRSRYYEYDADGRWQEDPTSDLGRESRQQLALRQLAAAAESRMTVDPRPLLRELFATVTVDSGFTSEDALRYFAAMSGDHPSTTLTLPVQAEMQDEQDALSLAPGAQSVLDAVAGRPDSTATSVGTGPSAPTGTSRTATQANYEPTAC